MPLAVPANLISYLTKTWQSRTSVKRRFMSCRVEASLSNKWSTRNQPRKETEKVEVKSFPRAGLSMKLSREMNLVTAWIKSTEWTNKEQ